MVVDICWGRIIGESTCRHCGCPIELWQPEGPEPAYWEHPTGPPDPKGGLTGAGGVSVWCRVQRAEPVTD